MKRQTRTGLIMVGGFVLLILLMGVGWWFLWPKPGSTHTLPPDAIQVFLITPEDGAEFRVGDFVPVSLQAVGAEKYFISELFVNGLSQGMVKNSPEVAAWTWQPFSSGIHYLVAHVIGLEDEGGTSQVVTVNVLPKEGPLQVSAAEGQTLEQIANDFNLPVIQVADANPQLDPNQPLVDSQPVKLPQSADSQESGTGPSGESGSVKLITWRFTPLEAVENSYCYISPGDGNWIKLPKLSFEFLSGSPMQYVQFDLHPKAGQGVIQAQCWGWLGGTLKYLGQGESPFNTQQPDELFISGQGFQLYGTPQFPAETGGGESKLTSMPFALRKAPDVDECAKNFGNPFAAVICDAIMNAEVQQFFVLLWEWQPNSCAFNPVNCPWNNEIGGYNIYEIDKSKPSPKFLKQISQVGQKASVLPLPWGPGCYGVQAYPKDPILEPSKIAVFCMQDEAPVPLKTVLTPKHWITNEYTWVQNGDCDTYGSGTFSPQGNLPQVMVGSFIVDDDGKDCFQQGYSKAGVKFDLNELFLPPEAVIHKAFLKFSHFGHTYEASGLATNYKLSCVREVGTSKQDWTSQASNHIATSGSLLSISQYYLPFTTLSEWNTSPVVDVSAVVNNWIKNSSNNHGFILFPASAPNPLIDGSGICYSYLTNLQLEIRYFVPPN